MKEYAAPIFEVLPFISEDIVTLSLQIGPDNDVDLDHPWGPII